ncbi:MAG: NAD(+) diphosphatase [Kiritimatiellae bacterium]|jgi:NADH pyrophosphatase NudC (nudix superfamily)|nr:NAD(+) diphosphatase [Kiritimatiellia bacterium]
MLSRSDLQDLDFFPHAHAVVTPENQYTILFLFDSEYQILMSKDENGDYHLPTVADFDDIVLKDEIPFGFLGDFLCKSAVVEALPNNSFEPFNLREALIFFNSHYQLISRSKMILHWHHRSKFCGACGTTTALSNKEICKVCENCGELYFPVIAPAAITLIRNGDKILLAHNKKFKSGLFSIIAGFTEAGESLEECVHREIFEEVGIRVKNIKYFGSQAWPFHNSHMIGFTAEYDSGEVTPDNIEIFEADWFSIDELPSLPSNISISRKLLDYAITQIENNEPF